MNNTATINIINISVMGWAAYNIIMYKDHSNWLTGYHKDKNKISDGFCIRGKKNHKVRENISVYK